MYKKRLQQKHLTLLLLLLLAFSIILILCFVNSQNIANADTVTKVIDVTLITIDQNHVKTSTSVGSISASYDGNKYILGSTSSTTSGIGYYLNKHNVTSGNYFSAGEYYPITTKNGQYVFETQSSITSMNIFNPYNTITYTIDRGTCPSPRPNAYYVTEDTTITLPTPIRDGFKFAGWAVNDDNTNCITSFKTKDYKNGIHIYTIWSEIYSIPVYKTSYTHYEESVSKIGTIDCYLNATGEYYIFDNKFYSYTSSYPNASFLITTKTNNQVSYVDYNGRCIYFATAGIPKRVDITDTAYSIIYQLNDGLEDPDNPLYNYYFSIEELSNLPIPIKDGYKFLGWFLDDQYNNISYTLSTPGPITLYAKWAKSIKINAYYRYTDYYSDLYEIVDVIDVYESNNMYAYSTNINSLNDKKSDTTTYYVYNGDTEIPTYNINGTIYSNRSYGLPTRIELDYPNYYSITYHFNEGLEDPDNNLINYYYIKDDLLNRINKPIKEDSIFLGWYLDSGFLNYYDNSSFTPSNIDLYAKWSKKYYIDVYYYDVSSASHDYEVVGSIYYYENENFYFYGYHKDSSDQLGYYYDKYDATSFALYDDEMNPIKPIEYNGYMISNKSEGAASKLYIYKHYIVKYFVNGKYYFETYGAYKETVEFPNFINGFIGENYDALKIGLLTIGKEYALYIFKGWSYTDTSDITWFNKEDVNLITTMSYGDTDEYVVKVYAYMEFYGKLNSLNSEIDYDNYISQTNGIITDKSDYSLDDLMQEHVTIISADSQKTAIDKIATYFNFDDISLPTLSLFDKLFSGEEVSFNDLWQSILGKIIIGFLAAIILSLIIAIIINIMKNLFTPNRN